MSDFTWGEYRRGKNWMPPFYVEDDEDDDDEDDDEDDFDFKRTTKYKDGKLSIDDTPLSEAPCYYCMKSAENHITRNSSFIEMETLGGAYRVFHSVNCLKEWAKHLVGEHSPWDYK